VFLCRNGKGIQEKSRWRNGTPKALREHHEDVEEIEQSSREDSVDLVEVAARAQRAEKEGNAKAIMDEGEFRSEDLKELMKEVETIHGLGDGKMSEESKTQGSRGTLHREDKGSYQKRNKNNRGRVPSGHPQSEGEKDEVQRSRPTWWTNPARRQQVGPRGGQRKVIHRNLDRKKTHQ
jgi:hypothetical protein